MFWLEAATCAGVLPPFLPSAVYPGASLMKSGQVAALTNATRSCCFFGTPLTQSSYWGFSLRSSPILFLTLVLVIRRQADAATTMWPYGSQARARDGTASS